MDDASDPIHSSRYADVIEQLGDGVLIAAPEGIVEYANAAWSRVTGEPRERTIGRPLDTVLSHVLEAAALSSFRQALTDGQPWHHRLAARAAAGPAVEHELVATTLYSGDRVTGVVVIGRDVSRQASLEQQLHRALKMESIGLLASGISHDSNNLLTAISGYSELAMLSLAADDPARQSIVEIQKAAERAGTLTRQLLTFSRKQVLQPRVLSLNDVILDVERMLRRAIGEDVELVLELDQRGGRITADPAQLELILVNLALNAREAMPQGGRLTIATGETPPDPADPQRPPFVRMNVTDTGLGMTDAVRARVFEPFFTTKEAGHGTGLGLPAVLGIVEQCGGHISVTSAPGRGACFTIDLPAALPTPPRATAVESRARPHECVLIVEDDAALRRMLVQVLGGQGYDVVDAGGADIALARARSHHRPIDLAVVDIVLPRQSGLEVAEQLTAIMAGLRVLFISGYAPGESVRHQLSRPGVSLLPKPFKPAELLARVRALLDEAPARPAADA